MNWDLILGFIIGFIIGGGLFAALGVSERSDLLDELYQIKKPTNPINLPLEESPNDDVEFTGDKSILEGIDKDEKDNN